MIVRIKARRDGFRRCGITHRDVPVDYPVDHFSDEDLERLQAEPMLIVEMVACPDDSPSGDDGLNNPLQTMSSITEDADQAQDEAQETDQQDPETDSGLPEKPQNIGNSDNEANNPPVASTGTEAAGQAQDECQETDQPEPQATAGLPKNPAKPKTTPKTQVKE